jgi:tripartite-type tricarboxylate transporter receptor subunit TctC
MIGAEIAARAAPDGYTLLVTTSQHAIVNAMYEKRTYDLVRDFASISLIASTPFILVVHPSLAASSVKDLVALAKAKPTQLRYRHGARKRYHRVFAMPRTDSIMKPASRAAAIAFLLAAFTNAASAQSYPTKPIRLIAPSSPGSGVDIVSRIVAQPLGADLGQQVVVDNRAGAGGNIGADIAAKSAPNGYTLITCTPSQVINAILYKNLSRDLLAEFAPITLIGSGQFVLIVNHSVPAKSVQQLIQLAKAKPGALHYASAGQGNVTHLTAELFKATAGVDLTHVPYKGSGPALGELMGGQVQVMFANIVAAMPVIRSGKVQALGSTGAKRTSVAPEIPTLAESGVPGFEVTAWFGMLAPKATPRDIVMKLNAAVVKALKSADTRQRLGHEGLDAIGSTPAEFAAYLQAEAPKWAKAVEISGTRAN